MSDKKEALEYKVKGIISSYEYATSPYDKQGAQPMHRIGIKFNDGERDALVKFCDANNVYKNTGEDFKPSWYKPREGHDNDTQYINLKSKFDVTAFYTSEEDTGDKVVHTSTDGTVYMSTLGDMASNFGSFNGSDVVVRLTVKEGAIYPLSVTFRKLKTRSFEDLFDEEDLPFN